MDIWKQIKLLEGTTLKTLAQKRPFDVKHVGQDLIIVTPHYRYKNRPIERDVIEDAYRALKQRGELSARDVQKEFAEFNAAFVSALLAQLPDVEYELNPIRLFKKYIPK